MTGLKVATSIEAVSKPDKLRQWMEQAITNYLVPPTFTHEIAAVALSQGVILAVNIPASRYLISLWDRNDHTVEYLRRTSHGKDWMNPDEAERHMMDGSRVAKLSLIASRNTVGSDEVDLAGGFWLRHKNHTGRDERFNPTGPVKLGRVDDYSFELLVPRGAVDSIVLPYGVVKEAWATPKKVGLLLTVRIVVHYEGGVSIES